MANDLTVQWESVKCFFFGVGAVQSPFLTLACGVGIALVFAHAQIAVMAATKTKECTIFSRLKCNETATQYLTKERKGVDYEWVVGG